MSPHARRRLRERLPGVSSKQILKQVQATRGLSTSPISGIKTHFIHIDGKQIKAVFDWRKHRLVTVMPVKEVHE